MLSLLEKHAVVCGDSIKDLKERETVLTFLKENREVVNITINELSNFGANIINIRRKDNDTPLLVLSKTSFDNYTVKTKKTLSSSYELCPVNINKIEKIGGGSARCMIAEVY